MSGNSIGRQTIALVSAQPDLLASFLTTCGTAPDGGELQLPKLGDVVLRPYGTAGLAAGTVPVEIEKSDALVLLVRFVDGETLDQVRAALGRLPVASVRTLNVLLCRNAGESEFKMSCPKCGQKLMIRDALAFKRVACPNCKKGFTVPGQADLLHEQLMISSMRTIRKVTIGDAASCLQALGALTWQVHSLDEASKSSTMRIDLPPETA